MQRGVGWPVAPVTFDAVPCLGSRGRRRAPRPPRVRCGTFEGIPHFGCPLRLPQVVRQRPTESLASRSGVLAQPTSARQEASGHETAPTGHEPCRTVLSRGRRCSSGGRVRWRYGHRPPSEIHRAASVRVHVVVLVREPVDSGGTARTSPSAIDLARPVQAVCAHRRGSGCGSSFSRGLQRLDGRGPTGGCEAACCTTLRPWTKRTTPVRWNFGCPERGFGVSGGRETDPSQCSVARTG